ncbi:hypothetical protein MVES_003489 [Malassezia vespertilionis]|uniref:Uncharacterized protein n=1 Tax=Malassezia vespertilionis TaxID=2020962 RepID=A0A2N1J7R8_9BASI|nr:hypothetical protein MVES_003489 [Malassezia vespertilionis]
MARGIGIAIAQFLLFSAFVLTLLANMGQITSNIVARNISFGKLEIKRVDTFVYGVSHGAAAPGSLDSYRYLGEIAWGLYSHCMKSDRMDILCQTTPTRPGDEVKKQTMGQPFAVGNDVDAFLAASKLPSNYGNAVDTFFDDRLWSASDKSHRNESIAAMYLIFLGTIFTFVALVLGCFVVQFFTALCAACSFLAFALILCGASLWTYFMHKFVQLDMEGAEAKYGNALWFLWASVFCTLVATILLSFVSKPQRRRYDDDEGPYY